MSNYQSYLNEFRIRYKRDDNFRIATIITSVLSFSMVIALGFFAVYLQEDPMAQASLTNVKVVARCIDRDNPRYNNTDLVKKYKVTRLGNNHSAIGYTPDSIKVVEDQNTDPNVLHNYVQIDIEGERFVRARTHPDTVIEVPVQNCRDDEITENPTVNSTESEGLLQPQNQTETSPTSQNNPVQSQSSQDNSQIIGEWVKFAEVKGNSSPKMTLMEDKMVIVGTDGERCTDDRKVNCQAYMHVVPNSDASKIATKNLGATLARTFSSTSSWLGDKVATGSYPGADVLVFDSNTEHVQYQLGDRCVRTDPNKIIDSEGRQNDPENPSWRYCTWRNAHIYGEFTPSDGTSPMLFYSRKSNDENSVINFIRDWTGLGKPDVSGFHRSLVKMHNKDNEHFGAGTIASGKIFAALNGTNGIKKMVALGPISSDWQNSSWINNYVEIGGVPSKANIEEVISSPDEKVVYVAAADGITRAGGDNSAYADTEGYVYAIDTENNRLLGNPVSLANLSQISHPGPMAILNNKLYVGNSFENDTKKGGVIECNLQSNGAITSCDKVKQLPGIVSVSDLITFRGNVYAVGVNEGPMIKDANGISVFQLK
jgi:hypothetical protein